jgi:uncharacterized protein (TIGR03663 family)
MKNAAFAGLILLVFTAALLFRVIHLDRRPMHHDEANQAVKFGTLLEKGEYRYDRTDHHGPSLYYLTLPSAWLFSQKTLAALDENTLRLLPAVFGACIFLLFLGVNNELGRDTVIYSGLLLAVSPVCVFYSRFYIQEMLLVFFLVGFLVSVWKCLTHPTLGWAVLAGISSGMMYATKETSVIAFGAVMGGIGIVLLLRNRGKGGIAFGRGAFFLLAGAMVFFIITWLFYSSFLQNTAGLVDSIRSFGSYFVKASRPGTHAHPWLYYLKMLSFSKYGRGPFWSEGLILGLAVFGSVATFHKRLSTGRSTSFLKFIFFYTFICLLVFSSIAYKTPWNLLPFYIGIILLAGAGMSSLLRLVRKPSFRAGLIALLGLGILHLGLLAYRSSFVYNADPRNPYVYAQTSSDFLNLVQRVEDISSLHPDGRNMLVKVIAGPYETWPLPWYLRQYGRVGYWQDVESGGDLEGVPLIIASMEMSDALPSVVRESCQLEFFGLRPEVLLAVFIRRDLWENFLKRRAE